MFSGLRSAITSVYAKPVRPKTMRSTCAFIKQPIDGEWRLEGYGDSCSGNAVPGAQYDTIRYRSESF